MMYIISKDGGQMMFKNLIKYVIFDQNRAKRHKIKHWHLKHFNHNVIIYMKLLTNNKIFNSLHYNDHKRMT